jgi:hypothetical protein
MAFHLGNYVAAAGGAERDMDFCSEYPHLEAAQQDRFRAVVTKLLSGHVLTPGSAMRPDPDWRFAERYAPLLDGYLRIGGWRLDIDLGLRLCRAVHESGEQRVRFSKLESLTLCVLRLCYHEQMQQVSAEERCEMKVGELRERMVQAGKAAGQLSRRAMAETLKKLARHSLVTIERGFLGEDSEMFVIMPLIEKVMPADRIADVASRVRAYQGLDSEVAREDDDDTGDVL